MTLGYAPAGAGVRYALREATRRQHAVLGSAPQMRRLFAHDYTLREYETHLARLLGFFEPLEDALSRAAPWYRAGGYARSGALRDDLTAMGWPPSALARVERCTNLPRVRPAGARGCAYVLLGSMLGGRAIALQVRRVLGPDAATNFYRDGTGELDRRWTSLCEDLEDSARDLDALCAAARATFDAYAAWIGPSQ